MYGNAKIGNDEKEEILSADVDLCLVGVSKDATEEQLESFIKGKGIDVLEIECLSHKDARTNTFRVKIKAAEYDKAMKPEVWPYRVGVRHFKPKRRTHSSWKDQSAQSGGNIEQQHRGGPRYPQQAHPHRSGGQASGGHQPPQPFQLPLNNRYDVDGFQAEQCN